jgi:hypothetical protein
MRRRPRCSPNLTIRNRKHVRHMPNIENIDRLIATIRADDGKHFVMGTWCNYLDNMEIDGRQRPDDRRTPTKYELCNTAFCLGGWIAFLEFQDAHSGKTLKQLNGIELPDFDDGELIEKGAEWLDIEEDEAHGLFMMHGVDMDAFDTYPHGMRAKAAIQVLELLKVDGMEDWEQALIDVGMLRFRGDDLEEYKGPYPEQPAPTLAP